VLRLMVIKEDAGAAVLRVTVFVLSNTNPAATPSTTTCTWAMSIYGKGKL
jgi:hypothetical protein